MITRNIEIEDIRKKQAKALDTREPRHALIPAEIIEVNGSTTPNGRPNYLWVREFSRMESARVVRNETSVTVAGTPVVIEVDPKKPDEGRVVGLYDAAMTPNEDINIINYNIGPHRTNHQYPTEATKGTDAVLVYQPAIQPLKVTGDGATLTVTVQSHVYVENGVRYAFSGGVLDLTSYVPVTANRVKRVLVYLNKNTNMVTVQDGTEVVDNGIIPIPYPTAPRHSKPAGYVRLETGQTGVTTATHVEDARDFLGSDDIQDYTVFRWIWSDAGERAATGVTSDQLYYLGLQIDDWSVWVLADDSPATWEPIGSGDSSFIVEDATTNASVTALTVGHNTTGTPALGLGVDIEFVAETSTTESTALGRIGMAWAAITHSARQAVIQFFVRSNNGEYEAGVIRGTDGNNTPGDARGEGAIDFQVIRSNSAQVASGYAATIIGGEDNQNAGDHSIVAGGFDNEVGSGANYAIVAGGSDNTVGGVASVILGGQNNQVTGVGGGSIASSNGVAEADYSLLLGGSGAYARRVGEVVNANTAFNVTGDAQAIVVMTLRREITHNSGDWFTIYPGGVATDYITLEIDTALVFDVLVVGLTAGAAETFGFQVVGVIENDGGTTAIKGSPTVTTLYVADSPLFEARAVADNTNDALLIQVRDKNAGGDTVRWVAHLRAVEVGYPA